MCDLYHSAVFLTLICILYNTVHFCTSLCFQPFTFGTHIALGLGMFATTNHTEVNMSAIPEITKQWHVKPAGQKVCSTCQCDNVRAGVRHRIREDKTGYWYEKIIKVCFGTDTSIEVIKPKH